MAFRTEIDSMGPIEVPADVLYGAQTQRAVLNFPYEGTALPINFITALAHVKAACATANAELGLMEAEMSSTIKECCAELIADPKLGDHFPISCFQTGSGTSTNMNMNEVLSRMATAKHGSSVHPNDHINMSQSSNDVIPTALNVSVYLQANNALLPSLHHLQTTIEEKAATLNDVVKTGRTHLMDAMPITMGQEMGGWAEQIAKSRQRVTQSLVHVRQLAIGGTAVGTGINAHPEFGARVAAALSVALGAPFERNPNSFEALSAADSIVGLSGQLKTVAGSMNKLANDLRWMNSGPIAGFGEIALPALQPGSSIMPGKINPVIPESVAMVCAQVMGNDVTITMAGASGSFQLNVMLPLLARNALQSVDLLATAATLLADKAISGFTVNRERVAGLLDKNPILVTALNPIVGYELGAKIAKAAYAQGRALKDVAAEMTDLTPEELERYLNPAQLTEGGVAEK